jgi:hypothetical protein
VEGAYYVVFWLTLLGSLSGIITTMRFALWFRSKATRGQGDAALLAIGCLFLGLALPVWITDVVRYNMHGIELTVRSLAHTIPIFATLLAQVAMFISMGKQRGAKL